MNADSAAFGDEFLNNLMLQTRWNSFLKKKKALIQVSMADMMVRVKVFVRPLLEGTVKTTWNVLQLVCRKNTELERLLAQEACDSRPPFLMPPIENEGE